MKFYVNGKKVAKKTLVELVGLDRFNAIVKEAKQAHAEDPLEEVSFMVRGGILNIEF